MSDLSITATSVKIGGAGAITQVVQFGETVTQGQPVYLKSSDAKYWKADVNASVEAAKATGIVLTPAAGDAYGVIQTEGPIVIGATVAVGTSYQVSATAGGISATADFSGYTGAFQQHIGYAISTTVIQLKFFTTGATN